MVLVSALYLCVSLSEKHLYKMSPPCAHESWSLCPVPLTQLGLGLLGQQNAEEVTFEWSEVRY